MVPLLLLMIDSADVFLLDWVMLVVRCLLERGDFCEPALYQISYDLNRHEFVSLINDEITNDTMTIVLRFVR